MSWDCPYLVKDICNLNRISCVPTKGNCILRGKVEIMSSKTNKLNKTPKKDHKERFRNL